jgi:hypothetical protein
LQHNFIFLFSVTYQKIYCKLFFIANFVNIEVNSMFMLTAESVVRPASKLGAGQRAILSSEAN